MYNLDSKWEGYRKDKGKDTQYKLISNDNCKGSTRICLQQSGTDDKSLDKDNDVTVVLI